MEMLKNKQMIVSLILVCLIVVSPMAEAQLGGLDGLVGGLGGLVGGLGALVGGLVGDVFNSVSIKGLLFCSLNGALNGTSTPVFPNARVELRCGRQNQVVSTTTTNTAGLFTLPTNAIQMMLSTLLTECKMVVTTPLSTCNASLPIIGNLVSPLSIIGSGVSGPLRVINMAPLGFDLLN